MMKLSAVRLREIFVYHPFVFIALLIGGYACIRASGIVLRDPSCWQAHLPSFLIGMTLMSAPYLPNYIEQVFFTKKP